MLAIINPYGWNADQSGNSGVSSDVKTRSFNILCSLHSLATCAAGGTPTAVNPAISGTATKNASFNCIKLLSNTEAGGWNVGISNSVTAATTYDAGLSSPFVDLYRDSGKSSYPWYRYVLGHGTYPYSDGSFTSYAQMEVYAGCTSSNPASSGYTSNSGFGSGTGSTAVIRNSSSGSYTSSPTQAIFQAAGNGTNEVYAAVTANYIILTYTGQIYYYGIRDQAGWELGRTDNPAWASFAASGDAGSSYHAINNAQHSEWAWAFMATINNSGITSGASKRGYQRTYESGYNAITGQTGSSASNNQFNSPNTGYLRPLFPMGYPSQNSVGYGWAQEAPVTDPVTGLTVPPAYPIVFNYGDGSQTCSGQIPGIYKGMSQDVTGLNFYVTASEYTIGGQAYVPVRTASVNYPELFFLRKA